MRGVRKAYNITERIKKDPENINSVNNPQHPLGVFFFLSMLFLAAVFISICENIIQSAFCIFRNVTWSHPLKKGIWWWTSISFHSWDSLMQVLLCHVNIPPPPAEAKLGDRRKDSISASCHHCLLHPHSTNLLPLVEAKMTGGKMLLLLPFLKGNNVKDKQCLQI